MNTTKIAWEKPQAIKISIKKETASKPKPHPFEKKS